MHDKRAGVIWMLISAAAYSTFTIFGKNALDDLEPNQVLLWRFLVASPLAWAIVAVRARRGGPSPRDVAWWPRFAAGLVFGGTAWFAFAGLSRLSGALYVVIIYTYPGMVAIGTRLLGRPSSRHTWTAVLFIVVGIALTVPEVFDGGNKASVLGLIFTLANAITYAGYVIYSGTLVRGEGAADGIVASAWSFTGSLVAAVLISLATRSFGAPGSYSAISSMIGLGTVSTVVAGTAFFLGVRHLGPTPAALIASTEPVLTLIWVVLILDESLGAVQLAGAALVISGVLWSQRPDRASPRVQATSA